MEFYSAITGPIFTAGAIYGQVLQAEATDLAALMNYERTIQNAFADVEDALVAHTMLIEQLAARNGWCKPQGSTAASHSSI